MSPQITKGPDGRYRLSLVELGNRLQNHFGLTVTEHEAFGGVTPGAHTPKGDHYNGNGALDIQDWRGGPNKGDKGFNGVGYQERSKNLFRLLEDRPGQTIGPGSSIPGHESHVHIGGIDGHVSLNQQQYDILFGGNAGGKMATFAFDSTASALPTASHSPEAVTDGSSTKTDGPSPAQLAVDRTQQWVGKSKSELDAAYDKVRNQADGASIGMDMHKAYFNKPRGR